MSTGAILLIVGVFYFLAHALSLVFQKTRIPDVLILVSIGILLGPVFQLAEPGDFGRMGSVLTVVALSVILFESGTSLRLSTMASSLSSTVFITFATAIMTILVTAIGTVAFFDGNWSMAILTGIVLCGPSSAVVIPMAKSLKLSDKSSTILVLESSLTDVIAIVLTFALVESIREGSISLMHIGGRVTLSLAFAAVIGILGGLFWLMIWESVRKLPATVFTTIAFAFVLYGIAEISHVSGAIATLAFGVTLSNLPLIFTKAQLPKISEPEKGFYQEIVFLLKIFFFIYLGVSVRISDPKIITTAIAIVAAVYFLRLWITRFTLTKKGISTRDASMVAILVPKGLAAAVLSSLIVQSGIEGAGTLQAIVFAIVIFSIFLTAVLVPLVDKGSLSRLYQKALPHFEDVAPQETETPSFEQAQ